MRFHAWQAVVALGLLGIGAVAFLGLAFVLLLVSPTAFWTMLWLSAATGAAWIGCGGCAWSAPTRDGVEAAARGHYAQKPSASAGR